jgi:hypothetical protein
MAHMAATGFAHLPAFVYTICTLNSRFWKGVAAAGRFQGSASSAAAVQGCEAYAVFLAVKGLLAWSHA